MVSIIPPWLSQMRNANSKHVDCDRPNHDLLLAKARLELRPVRLPPTRIDIFRHYFIYDDVVTGGVLGGRRFPQAGGRRSGVRRQPAKPLGQLRGNLTMV